MCYIHVVLFNLMCRCGMVVKVSPQIPTISGFEATLE